MLVECSGHCNIVQLSGISRMLALHVRLLHPDSKQRRSLKSSRGNSSITHVQTCVNAPFLVEGTRRAYLSHGEVKRSSTESPRQKLFHLTSLSKALKSSAFASALLDSVL